MNGAAHYAEAEKNLAAVDFIDDHEDQYGPGEAIHESKTQLLAEAQVHATLALVAITALQTFGEAYPEIADRTGWVEVIA